MSELEHIKDILPRVLDALERCKGCGHEARLHAAIGAEPTEGAKCVTCQCDGLVVDQCRLANGSMPI